MLARIFYNLLLLGALFILPLWLFALCILALSFIVKYRFYEFVYFGIILDVMYGSYPIALIHLPRFMLLGLVLLLAVDMIKKRMNIYV